MESRENVWENASGMGTAPAYGRPPGRMGNQNRMKAKNGTMEYDLRTLRLFGKKCGHRGDMKVYKRRSIRLDYSWRG